MDYVIFKIAGNESYAKLFTIIMTVCQEQGIDQWCTKLY